VAPHSASHAEHRLSSLRRSTLTGKWPATYPRNPERRKARRANDAWPAAKAVRALHSFFAPPTPQRSCARVPGVGVSGECAGFTTLRSDGVIWTDCKNALVLQRASLNQQSKDAPNLAVRGVVYGRRAQVPQTNAINR
jgi:hypothetical protein